LRDDTSPRDADPPRWGKFRSNVAARTTDLDTKGVQITDAPRRETRPNSILGPDPVALAWFNVQPARYSFGVGTQWRLQVRLGRKLDIHVESALPTRTNVIV
jgi:hypothetical protein